MRKILDLPLKKEWYSMIESGVKTESTERPKTIGRNVFLAEKIVFSIFRISVM